MGLSGQDFADLNGSWSDDILWKVSSLCSLRFSSGICVSTVGFSIIWVLVNHIAIILQQFCFKCLVNLTVESSLIEIRFGRGIVNLFILNSYRGISLKLSESWWSSLFCCCWNLSSCIAFFLLLLYLVLQIALCNLSVKLDLFRWLNKDDMIVLILIYIVDCWVNYNPQLFLFTSRRIST